MNNKRITARSCGYAYYPKCFEEPCGGAGCKNDNCDFLIEACERLAAYEDSIPFDRLQEAAEILKAKRLAARYDDETR